MKKSKSQKSELIKPSSNGADKKDFIVVGIGASAGGVKALKEFFGAMPADSGMAFVVILHLSPDRESNLAAVLQTQIAMPVGQVKDVEKVEPNRVYVIAPHQKLMMVDGTIQAVETAEKTGARPAAAIDVFLRSLADAYGARAVGVLLSGAGEDGTLGIKRVKENNGFVIVQQPEDTEFDSMPRSAIATELVDWVLPIAEMPAKLIAFRETSEKLRLTSDDDDEVAKEVKGGNALREVLALLRVRTGHDFSNYKPGTLLRRIARHLQINDLEDLPAYLKFLHANPDEVHSLLKNLLINVTNFFRDPEAFEALEKRIVPELFNGKGPDDAVRVWVAACASGEEAYSMAMLLAEYAERATNPPKIQIFATDIDDEAIAQAREHRFPETIAADVSPERLRRFFVKEGNSYYIKKELREMILFAPHNVLRDPPFSRLDLVSCRNLMIYLNRDSQERVLEIFHFALRGEGFLFLGNSETADSLPALYDAMDKKNRIYSCRSNPAQPNRIPPILPVQSEWQSGASREYGTYQRDDYRASSYGELHFKLIEKYAPPSVLLGEDFEIVHSSETAGRFLQFAGGEPSNNIFKVVHPDLLADLRAAVYTARNEHRLAEFQNIRVKIGVQEIFVNLVVRPVKIQETGADFLLVIFDESLIKPVKTRHPEKKASPSTAANKDDTLKTVVRALEDDLQRTKDRLRATIEQHETAIEELKASNEELQAINEELRSAGEELETSKEELQAVNEELVTVNLEAKERVEELSGANSDLQNFLSSSGIATIFLDRSFRIKRYTTPAQQLFNVESSDIGRPIEHFTHNLVYENLTRDADEVLRTLKTLELEISSTDGRFFMARFSPYRTVDDRISGVVLNFIDITERRRAVETLRASEKKYRKLFDSIDEGYFVCEVIFGDGDQALDVLYLDANPAARRMVGQDFVGRRLSEIDPDYEAYWHEIFASVARTGKAERLERHIEPDKKWYDFHVYKIVDEGGNRVAVMFQDITERKRQEEETRRLASQLEQQARLFDTTLTNITDFTYIFDRDGRFVYSNRPLLDLLGITLEEIKGKNFFDLGYPQDLAARHQAEIEQVFRTGKPIKADSTFTSPVTGVSGFYEYIFTPVFAAGGGETIESVAGSTRDITRRKQTENELRESREHLQRAMEAGQIFSWELNLETQEFSYSENIEAVLGFKLPAQNIQNPVESLMHPEDAPLAAQETLRAVETGEAYQQSIRFVNPQTGEILWMCSQGGLTRSADGRKVFAGIARNITEEKRAEEELRRSAELNAFRVKLNDILRPLSDPVEIQAAATQVLGDYLQVDIMLYAELSDDGETLHVADSYMSGSCPKVSGDFSLADFGVEAARKLGGGTTFVVEDVRRSREIAKKEKAIYGKLEIAAFAVVPLIKDNRWVSNLCAYHGSPRRWTPEEITILQETAERTWVTVTRARAEESLRDSEERLRELIKNLPGGAAFILDRDLRYLLAEGEALHAAGFKGKDLVGKTIFEALSPEMAASYEPKFRGALAGEEFTQEHSAHGLTLISRGTPLRAANGDIYAVLAVSYDISERKRVEEALRESEERYRVTLEAAELASWDWDVDADHVVWNAQHYLLFGLEPGDGNVKSDDFLKFVYREDYQYVREQMEKAVSETGKYEAEFRIVRADNGEIRWMHGYGRAVETENGRVKRMSGAMYDVTANRLAASAIRESEERLRAIMDSAEDYAIMTLDREGHYTGWNKGAEEVFGYTETEALGQSSSLIFTPEDVAGGEHLKELETARREGRAADERFHQRKDGSRFYVSGVLMRLEGGNEKYAFAKIARDLTERQQMEEALKEADRRKDEFLATLAHELRNPLAPIRSGLEIVRRASSDKESRMEALGIIERQTNQMVRLVDDLLDISRITQGKIKLRPKRMNLKRAVEMSLEGVREMLDKAGHELTVSVPEEDVCIDGDFTRIAQILQNLLSNAGKYTLPGGKIWLTVKKEDGNAFVSVRDTGVGIPPTMRHKIFEMFSQIESASEQSRGGLGIGLSVVKRLVEMHGGTIEVFSEGEGKGSEFILRFPLAEDDGQLPDEEPTKTTTKPPRSNALTPEAETDSAQGNTHRILVIDDNADAAQMLQILLSMEGHEVRLAFDAETGIETGREMQPDVCLLDIGLPGMNGYEAARQLREFLPDALLISISGWGQEEDRRRSSEAGFDHHLVKPVEIEDINKLLDE